MLAGLRFAAAAETKADAVNNNSTPTSSSDQQQQQHSSQPGADEEKTGSSRHDDRQRRDRHRERLGFRRPTPDDPAATVTVTEPSALSSGGLSTRSPSPDSASSSSASSAGGRSWRERIRERREGAAQGADEDPQHQQQQPPPIPRLRSAASPLYLPASSSSSSASRMKAQRFAGLPDAELDISLPPLPESPTADAAAERASSSLPAFIPQPISWQPEAKVSTPTPADSATERAAEINRLAAKAVKAKLMRDSATHDRLQQQIAQLKAEAVTASSSSSSLSSSRAPSSVSALTPAAAVLESENEHDHEHNNVVILSELDASGRPVSLPSSLLHADAAAAVATGSSSRKRRAGQHVEKMVDGQRVAYRDDDVGERKSVLQMAAEERLGSAGDESGSYDATYAANIAKRGRYREQNPDDEFDALDSTLGLWASKRSLQPPQQQMQRQQQQQRADSERYADVIGHCPLCPSSASFPQHLLVSTGVRLFLSLPRHGSSVVDGHCLLTTLEHSVSQTEWDELQEEEMLYWRRHLAAMYHTHYAGSRPVFLETVTHRRRMRHTAVHCLPLPADVYADVSVVFSSAITDSEGEQTVNRPLITVKGGAGAARRALPAAPFPYFVVENGVGEGGWAHVVEDESRWQDEFGLEVVRGLLGLDSRGGRARRAAGGGRDAVAAEVERMQRFRQRWQHHDWTQRLLKNQQPQQQKRGGSIPAAAGGGRAATAQSQAG